MAYTPKMLNIVIFLLLVCSISAVAQKQKSNLRIDTVKMYVYSIEVLKKRIETDSTYSFGDVHKYYIASEIELQREEIEIKIRKSFESSFKSDSLFLSKDFIYIDELLYSDTVSYRFFNTLLSDANHSPFPENELITRDGFYSGFEYKYIVKCQNATWIRIIGDRNFFFTILGSSIQTTSDKSKFITVFVLKNSIRVWFL